MLRVTDSFSKPIILASECCKIGIALISRTDRFEANRKESEFERKRLVTPIDLASGLPVIRSQTYPRWTRSAEHTPYLFVFQSSCGRYIAATLSRNVGCDQRCSE